MRATPLLVADASCSDPQVPTPPRRRARCFVHRSTEDEVAPASAYEPAAAERAHIAALLERPLFPPLLVRPPIWLVIATALLIVALALVIPLGSGLFAWLGFSRAGDRVVEELTAADLDASLVASVLLVGATAWAFSHPALFAYLGALYAVHLLGVFAIGKKLLRLSTRELLVASNANVGGPATAGALAAGKNWTELVVPGMLVGNLGNALGTFVGLGMAKAFYHLCW